METTRLSDTFKLNFFFWKVFGLWPGRSLSKLYTYYSSFYLIVTFVMYNFLLTLNLIYTPRTIELLIREVIFYFTEVAVSGKVLMMVFKRKQILESFDFLDSDYFKGDDSETEKIVQEGAQRYKSFWKYYAVLSNFAYCSQVVTPLIMYLIIGSPVDLPICKYYFLSDEIISKYFTALFIYQSFGMYGHMTYNVNIDSFIGGLIWMAIKQLDVINRKMKHLMLEESDLQKPVAIREQVMISKLRNCLIHYDLILKYYSSIQKIINVAIFVQFGMSSAIICVVLCGLTLPSSTETLVFLCFYLFAMTCQIFVPGWLGTELTSKNRELAFAAFCSDWIPRSEKFKRSLRLFVERANYPMVLSGMKMFPLALSTFTSILKTGYSFFTLVRNVQAGQK